VTPAEIAKSLSEAQRAILVTQSPDFSYYTRALAEHLNAEFDAVAADCRELRDQGLLELMPVFCESDCLFKGSAWFPRSPLGLAVRQALQEQNSER